MACEPDNDLEGGREFRSGAIEASLHGAQGGVWATIRKNRTRDRSLSDVDGGLRRIVRLRYWWE